MHQTEERAEGKKNRKIGVPKRTGSRKGTFRQRETEQRNYSSKGKDVSV